MLHFDTSSSERPVLLLPSSLSHKTPQHDRGAAKFLPCYNKDPSLHCPSVISSQWPLLSKPPPKSCSGRPRLSPRRPGLSLQLPSSPGLPPELSTVVCLGRCVFFPACASQASQLLLLLGSESALTSLHTCYRRARSWYQFLGLSRLLSQNATGRGASKQQTFIPHHSGAWVPRTRL